MGENNCGTRVTILILDRNVTVMLKDRLGTQDNGKLLITKQENSNTCDGRGFQSWCGPTASLIQSPRSREFGDNLAHLKE